MNIANNTKQITIPEIRKATHAFLPQIMNITGIRDEILDAKIQEYIIDITNASPDTELVRPNSIFTFINGAGKGCTYYTDFLAYYDSQAQSLYDCFCANINWQGKIRGKLKQSILDYSDHNAANPSNPAFLNFIAEILYANTIIPNAQNGGYDFMGFDEMMNNGKDADLLFRRQDDNRYIYIDNMSIHGVDINQVGSAQDLYDFLKHRIKRKIEEKTEGLTKQDGFYVINGQVAEFHVAPILWNETYDMLPYKAAFQKFDSEKELSGLFVALMPQKLLDGHYHFSITAIKDILLLWEKQEQNKSSI